MGTVPVLSCFRFLIQLMVSEAAFLVGMPRRTDFWKRLAAALPLNYLLGFAWYHLLARIPMVSVFIMVLYWLGLFGMTLAVIHCCFKVSFTDLLFIGTGGYATEHMSFAVARIIQHGLHAYPETIGVVAENIIFRFLFYVLDACLVYRFLVRPNQDKTSMKPRDRRIAWLALILLVGAVVLSVFYSQNRYVEQRTLSANVLFPAYGLLFCLMVLVMIFYVLRENHMAEQQEMMEQLLQLANMQRKCSREAIDIINMKCHDLKHQISALAAIGDPESRRSYVDEVKKAVAIYDADYHTGSEVLDYILREKALIADSHHVIFSCMADGTALSLLSSADIYALMGNALDNALERVQQEAEEERTISLQIKRTGDMVLIHLENRCSRVPEFENGIPITDKEDKNAHGFGVRSMMYIVEKYKGEAYMRVKDGRFMLDILFPASAA